MIFGTYILLVMLITALTGLLGGAVGLLWGTTSVQYGVAILVSIVSFISLTLGYWVAVLA